MEMFLRTFAVYMFLFVLLRIAGKRSLSEVSTFDFVLLLIVGEAIQQALIGTDYSLANSIAVVLTLILLDLGMSLLKQRFNVIEKIAEGTPLVLVDHGNTLDDHMRKSHVTRDEILQSARELQGLERMDQVKYAVLEPNGGISIIPMEPRVEELLDRRIEQALERMAAKNGT